MNLDNYNAKGATSLISVNKIVQHQWCWFDFDISGYDPTVTTKIDPTFILEITGVTESNIVTKGTIKFVYDTPTAPKNGLIAGFNNTINGVTKNYTGVAKRYKDVTTAQAEYQAWADSTPIKTKWFSSLVKGACGVSGGNFIKALGSVASIINFAIGGGSTSATSPAPLLKRGDMELNGTLTTLAPLFYKTIRVSGSIHADPTNDALTNILPLYDIPLGIYNLMENPTIEEHSKVENYLDNYGSGQIFVNTNMIIRPLKYIYNPNIFSSCSIQLSQVSDNYNISNYVDKEQFYNTTICNNFSEDWENDVRIYINQYCGGFFEKLGVITTLNPKEINVNPVIILKSYTPNRIQISDYDSWQPTIYKEVPFSVNGTTVGKTNNWDVQGSDGFDVAYKIYLKERSSVNATLCNAYTNYDTKLEIFKEDGTRANYYNDDYSCTYSSRHSTINNAQLEQGIYYIVVDGYAGATGNYNLNVSCTSLKSANINPSSNALVLGDFDDLGKDNGLNETNTIKIFPNPVIQMLHIESKNKTINEIQVLDAMGRLLESFEPKLNQYSINCSNLKQGIYLLRIKSDLEVIEKKIQILKP